MRKLSIKLTVLVSFISMFSYAQDPVETIWERVFWPARMHINPDNPDGSVKPFNLTQEKSSDEWWYHHDNVYNNFGIQTGHIGIGYYSWINEEEDETTHNGLYSGPVGCCDEAGFEVLDYKKGVIKSSLMLFDNYGQSGAWCRSYYNGEFEHGKQTNARDGFIAVGRTSSTIHPRDNFNVYGPNTPFTENTPIIYNPTPGGTTANHFAKYSTYTSDQREKYKQKPIVTKVDNEGNILWSYIYGIRNYLGNGSSIVRDQGFLDYVEEDNNGNIWVIGKMEYKNLNDTEPYPNQKKGRAFLLILNSEGEVLQKMFLDNISGFIPLNYYGSQGTGLTFNNSGTEIYIGGSYATTPNGDDHNNQAFIGKFNTNDLLTNGTSASTLWWKNTEAITSMTFDGHSTLTDSRVDKFIVNSNNNLVLPILIGVRDVPNFPNYANLYDRGGKGRVHIYELNPSGTLIDSSIAIGEVMAFDLMVDIKQDTDGGYVLVSSKKRDIPMASSLETYLEKFNDIDDYLDNQYDNNGSGGTAYTYYNQPSNIYTAPDGNDYSKSTWMWDTDPYVAKLGSSLNLVWEHTFLYPGQTRQPFPGNIKRNECVYSISINSDNSYTIAGNTSDNFDDTYMLRFRENECTKAVRRLKFNDLQDMTQMGPSYAVYDYPNLDHILTDGAIYTTGNETIDGVSLKMNEPIVVETGHTLTISNSNIEFLNSRSSYLNFIGIIVHQGGTLILKNTTLTGLESIRECPPVWDGIRVNGKASASQYPLPGSSNIYQGKISLDNSTIKNARNGIITHGMDPYSFTESWSLTGGGIIYAKNSKFINNNRSIGTTSYDNWKELSSGVIEPKNNRSFINNCRFEKNLTYKTLFPFKGTQQITMWATHGIHISGCDFINTNPEAMTRAEKSGAIYSNDATYTVNGISNTPGASQYIDDKGSFSGYFKAIEAENQKILNGPIIRHQEFSKNVQDITLLRTVSARIGLNRFSIDDAQEQKGIVLKQSYSFFVYQNNFEGNNNVDSYTSYPYIYNEPDYGIVVDGNGSQNIFQNWATYSISGDIYKNKFTGLGSASFFTRSTNRSTTLNRCNTYGISKTSDNLHAIQISPTGYINPNHSFINSSGLQRPVGNTFSHFNPSSYSLKTDIENFAFFTLNYFHLNTVDHEPNNALITPNVNKTTNSSWTIEDCECKNVIWWMSANAGKRMANIEKLYEEWSNSNTKLNKLIDGGDKHDIIDLIEFGGSESEKLRDKLLKDSPYLSDEVLISIIKKERIMNDIHLAEILLANAPLSRKVKDVFMRYTPFGNPLAEIVLKPEGNGTRQILYIYEQSKLNQLRSEISTAISSSIENKDAHHYTVWNNIDRIDSKNLFLEERIESKVAQKKYEEAINLAYLSKENTDSYITWIEFISKLELRDWFEPSSEQIKTLKEWETGSDKFLSQKAYVIQKIKNTSNINADTYLQTRVETNPKILKETSNHLLPLDHWVKVSNNPVINSFTIYTDDYSTEVTYSVINVNGQRILDGKMTGKKTINSFNWSKGIYFIETIHPALGKDIIKVEKL